MGRNWYAILAVAFTCSAFLIGGGMATGREVIQFFGRFGSAGFWGTIVALVLFGYVGMVSLITATRWETYDYKSWLLRLYQGFMPKRVASVTFRVFDVSYLAFAPVAQGVMIAAMAELLNSEFGVPYAAGIVVTTAVILAVVTFGSEPVRAFNFYFAVGMFICLIIILAVAFKPVSGNSWRIITSGAGPGGAEWLLSAFLYVSFNTGYLAAITVAEPLKDRFSASAAGIIGGAGTAFPLIFIFVTIMAYYPQILEETLPLWFASSQTGLVLLRGVYDFLLAAAALTSAVGGVYVPVKRLAPALVEKFGEGRERLANLLLILLFVGAGLGLSTFGIIELVAKGYTARGWLDLVFLIFPLLIFGSIAVFWSGKGGNTAKSAKI